MAKIIGSKRSQKKVADNLDRIKKRIEDWHSYFQDNFRRFNRSRYFTFQSSLSDGDIAILEEDGKPQIEFNILEAFLSRLRGEFSKQEPTLNVSPKPTATDLPDADLLDFLGRYLHQIIFDSNRDNLQYDVLTDILSGGFSAVKVITEYAATYSFDQEFKFERFFDPTLSVFDKSARLSHKGDGKYSAELFPMTMENFKEMYGEDVAIKASPALGLGGFTWSYTASSGEEMVIVADYYEKRMRKEKIVQVAATADSPMQVMTLKEYEKFAEEWALSRIEQVPAALSQRTTDVETIDRYVICGNSVIEYQQTDWKYLPHVFIDGNSMIMRKEDEGASYQLTRPFLYQAEGLQRLKNYAGQCLGNALENDVQHKFMIALESIPKQYTDPLTDVQKASVVIFNAYNPDNTDQALPPPSAVPKAPIPPEITQTFMMCDQMIQTILGSYDSALGVNDNQLSGAAIVNGATQSNPVAMPFIVSYMKGMAQIGTILLDRIPKTIRTPRTMPITDKSGKKRFVKLNQEGGIKLEYDSDALDINIEPGVSFEIQRQKAFQMIIQLMNVSQEFAEFMNNSPAGIETLLDNLDIRGIDKLKENVAQFLQQKQQMQQQQQQQQQEQAQQQMQMQAEQMKLMARPMELKEQEIMLKAQKDAKEVQVKEDQVSINFMKAEAEIQSQETADALKAAEIQAHNIRSAVDLETRNVNTRHSHAMDILKMHDSRESRKPTVEVEINNESAGD